MAEATYLRNNALPYPIYGAPWTVVFPILNSTGGLVASAAGLDSEISLNGDTFADCTNEATQIATTSGMYYLSLTGAELTTDVAGLIVKTTTSKALTTPIVIYPRKLVTLASGTSQGGDTAYITVAAATVAYDDQFNGCVCAATIDSNIEVRVITDSTASNQRLTVTPAWNVAPDDNDTYVIYLPEGMQVPTANTTHVSGDSTAADRLEALVDGTPTGAVVDDNDPDPLATAFETNLTEATDDHYNGAFVVFYSGALLGQSRKISDYDGTNKIITVATAFTEAPAAGDTFMILGRSE